MALLVLLTLALRLIVYPVNEYLAGDAVSRVELAERWAAAPHVIHSFGDGAAQYGPLQLYLVGTMLSWVDRNDAAKLINLIAGVLTILPLFAVTRRYFGTRGATWACLAFAFWGLHVQLSTTGGSEALSLCLMWLAFAAFARALERPTFIAFAGAALAMNLAAATRYDAWMYVPILAVMPLLFWRDTLSAMLWTAAFVLLCLPFPVFWLVGNAAAHGNAFYPFTYINEFHRTWIASETHAWGGLWIRVQGLTFWPAMALATLTPGVALLGAAGMMVSARTFPATRWLVLAAVIPAVYYALRSAVLMDFVPLARFTVLQVSLLLPFIASGLAALSAWSNAATAGRFGRLTVAIAAAMPIALGAFTYFVDHRSAEILESISPTNRNSRAVIAAADFVRERVVHAQQSVALDEDATYQDIQLGFYGRVRDSATLRLRWPQFREQFERTPPAYVVLFEKGRLLREPWVKLEGSQLQMGRTRYEALDEFRSSVRIFRRAGRP